MGTALCFQGRPPLAHRFERGGQLRIQPIDLGQQLGALLLDRIWRLVRASLVLGHSLKEWLQEYIEAAGIAEDPNGPLFRSVDRKTKQLGANRLDRQRAWAMVKRRAKKAGIDTPGICNHTFRGTGITAYLENPEAKLEHAQQMAAHSDPKTTRLYDRRSDQVSLDDVERIGI